MDSRRLFPDADPKKIGFVLDAFHGMRKSFQHRVDLLEQGRVVTDDFQTIAPVDRPKGKGDLEEAQRPKGTTKIDLMHLLPFR